MSKFLIQFRVHVIESKRPKDEDFQRVYDINEIYEVEEDRMLGQIINSRYEFWLSQKGFTVTKEGVHIDAAEPLNNVSNRMFIPWHMVAYLDARYEPIPEPKKHPLDSLLPVNPPDPIEPTETIN